MYSMYVLDNNANEKQILIGSRLLKAQYLRLDGNDNVAHCLAQR